MSYRGRPSKGCESCRSRKVKCDEAKPICNRCARSGHDCKYRDQADLLFRNQTAFAAQKAEESWRKRSKSNQRNASEGNISFHSSSSRDKSPSSAKNPSPSLSYSSTSSEITSEGSVSNINFNDLAIAPELQLNIRRLAYERFIYDFVVFETPNKIEGQLSDSLWDFVPHLYQSSAEDSCLATIVDAVAYTNFANRCNAPEIHKLAGRLLGKGIKLLSQTISDKELAPSDSALCSVYLMGVYETLSLGQRKGSYVAHSSGANALLQLRTIEEFYTNPISARLYEVSYAQMLIFWQQLIGNLQAGLPPSIPIRNIATAKQYLPNFYSTSGVYVIQLIYNEARLHAQWHERKQFPSPPSNRIELQGLLKAALELDAEFQAWESTIPRSWRHTMEPNTPEARATYDARWRNLILGSRGAPEEIHSYTTLRRCWVWMFYRTSRIFLLRDILEILNWMFRLPQPEIDIPSAPPKMSTLGTYPSVSSLDNVALHVHRAFTTTHLVNIIEKSSSAILGHFTVPVYGKVSDDVMGMRGYTALWSLGVMDAVLRAGLVPDSGAPASPPGASLGQQLVPPPTLGLQFQGPLAVTAAMFGMAHENANTVYSNAPTPIPQQHQQSTPPHVPSHQRSASLPSAISSSTSTAPAPSGTSLAIPFIPRDPTRHIFDSSPSHPFDVPTNLPTLDFNITRPKQIDVAARREWVNRMLYYIGTELGIKKALIVPATEGYLETSKLGLDAMLGK